MWAKLDVPVKMSEYSDTSDVRVAFVVSAGARSNANKSGAHIFSGMVQPEDAISLCRFERHSDGAPCFMQVRTLSLTG